MPGFRPATRSAGKSGKASGKAAAKSGKATHATSAKPGGCGTGAGGFQAGNTCGHKGNRNQKVEAARAAHTAAKNDVLKHVKAHRAASKAAAKAGEAAPAPKDLHSAIKKAAAAHGELKAARDTHRAEQRDKRNMKAKGRRAVKAGRAEPLSARPKAPSLREQADKHRAGKGGHDDRARDVWRKAMERNSVASKERSREVERTLAGQKLKPKYERERQEKIDRLSRQQDRATRAARKAGNQIGKGNNPPTPPHTGLTSSQARPSATTRPSRNDRLAVLAARHDIAARRLAEHRDESAGHAYTGQVLSGKGNVNPESPTQRGRYSESHAIGRRAQIHKETAERLRESIHDPAKSGAAARTLRSLSKNPVGGRANESAIRATAGKLTHSELKAAATGAGLDHGGSRNRYELRDHLLRTVGKAKDVEAPKGPSLREQADAHRTARAEALKEKSSPNSFRDPSEFRAARAETLKAIREQAIRSAGNGRRALQSRIADLTNNLSSPGSARERGARYAAKLLESKRLKPSRKSR